MKEPKRISIFTGHFGSGKTEVALNYAFRLKEMGKDVIIIDFDIVNPYYRTKDAEALLEEKGIRVIAPGYANMNIENPSLPPEINVAFEDKSKYVIFDVGGDDDGATPLGRYHASFAAEPYELFFVLNARRMLTQDVDGALEIMRNIEAVSGLKVSSVINNTHLKQYTDIAVLEEGQALAEKFSAATGLPIAYITGQAEQLAQLPAKYNALKYPITLYINQDF